MFKHMPVGSNNMLLCEYFSLALAALALLVAMPVWSQTSYKCGNQYSQNPCEGGTALPTDDKRTAEQKTQALNATQKEKQAADNLEQTRLDKEKRELAALKKANATPEKSSAKASKTTLRPIKNKKLKADGGEVAKKGKTKKTKAVVTNP
jgi:hypothetical protein